MTDPEPSTLSPEFKLETLNLNSRRESPHPMGSVHRSTIHANTARASFRVGLTFPTPRAPQLASLATTGRLGLGGELQSMWVDSKASMPVLACCAGEVGGREVLLVDDQGLWAAMQRTPMVASLVSAHLHRALRAPDPFDVAEDAAVSAKKIAKAAAEEGDKDSMLRHRFVHPDLGVVMSKPLGKVNDAPAPLDRYPAPMTQTMPRSFLLSGMRKLRGEIKDERTRIFALR